MLKKRINFSTKKENDFIRIICYLKIKKVKVKIKKKHWNFASRRPKGPLKKGNIRRHSVKEFLTKSRRKGKGLNSEGKGEEKDKEKRNKKRMRKRKRKQRREKKVKRSWS